MRSHVPRGAKAPPGATADEARSLDERYGLEPVFEPGEVGDEADLQGGVQVQLVQCPYCGEEFETSVDTSSGSTRYIEDCEVCCRPIEFVVDVDHAGTLVEFSTLRSD